MLTIISTPRVGDPDEHYVYQYSRLMRTNLN